MPITHAGGFCLSHEYWHHRRPDDGGRESVCRRTDLAGGCSADRRRMPCRPRRQDASRRRRPACLRPQSRHRHDERVAAARRARRARSRRRRFKARAPNHPGTDGESAACRRASSGRTRNEKLPFGDPARACRESNYRADRPRAAAVDRTELVVAAGAPTPMLLELPDDASRVRGALQERLSIRSTIPVPRPSAPAISGDHAGAGERRAKRCSDC